MHTRYPSPPLSHRHRPTLAEICLWALLAGGLPGLVTAAQTGSLADIPGPTWQEIESPESVGFSSQKLEEARLFFDSLPSTALMIITDGRVLANWGKTDAKYPLHSIRKSILGLLYGGQIERGAISLDSTLAELGVPHLDLVVVHRVNSSFPNPANYVGSEDLGTLLQRIVDARLP